MEQRLRAFDRSNLSREANFSLCNVRKMMSNSSTLHCCGEIIFGNRVSDSRFAQMLRKWSMPIKLLCYRSMLPLARIIILLMLEGNVETLLDTVNNRMKSSFALLRMISGNILIFRNCENLFLIFFFNQECIEFFFFCIETENQFRFSFVQLLVTPFILNLISRSRLRLIFYQQSTRISRIPLDSLI